MGDKWDIAAKEVRDSFSSRKFLLILGLFVLFSFASVYLGVQQYESQLDSFSQGGIRYGDAPSPPSLINVFEPLVQFQLPLAAGLLALMLSYDSISGEREKGTIELLLSYPIYRDEVINGKFIAGIFTVAVAFLFSLLMSSGLAIYLTGKLPELSNIIRLGMVWIATVVYMAFFLGLGTLLSTALKSSWRSLIAGILLLLLFLGMPFIANIASSQLVYPTTPSMNDTVEETTRDKQQKFASDVSKFSPSTSFMRSVESMLGISYTGSSPTFTQSFSSAIGYILYLLSETFLVFTLSYAFFMRQDL